jgi:hypothetical protein
MKQHISENQLDELSDEARERLREWWLRRTIVGEERQAFLCKRYGECRYPRPSIGEMIEFLVEQNDGLFKIDFDESCGHAVYRLEFGHNGSDGYREGLSDALWKTCKEVLEHNNTGAEIARRGDSTGTE